MLFFKNILWCALYLVTIISSPTSFFLSEFESSRGLALINAVSFVVEKL